METIRTPLLLKILSVSPDSLTSLLEAVCYAEMELRYLNLDYLFNLLCHSLITAPAHHELPAQLSQLSYQLTPAIIAFFRAALFDEAELVRDKGDLYLEMLLPAHFARITAALATYFQASSTLGKSALCTFLLQLRARFPDLQVLSWRMIIDALYASNEDQSSEGLQLRLKLLALSSSLIVSNADISQQDIARIKAIVMQTIGYEDCKLEHNSFISVSSKGLHHTRADAGIMLSLVKNILDSSRMIKLRLPLSNADPESNSRRDLLVGTQFAEIAFDVCCSRSADLELLEPSALRSLVDCVLIAVYKHRLDTDAISIERATSAVRAVSRLLSIDTLSADVHSATIATMTAFLEEYPGLSTPLLGVRKAICSKSST